MHTVDLQIENTFFMKMFRKASYQEWTWRETHKIDLENPWKATQEKLTQT